MNKFALMIAAATVCTASSIAEEVWTVRVPESAQDPSTQWLQAKFAGFYGKDVRLRMVVTPSFSPVWAVVVKRSGDGYMVAYGNPLINVPNAGTSKPPLAESKCEASIAPALVERLIGVWNRMLTNYFPHQPESWDWGATTYEFVAGNGTLEKRTAIPQPKPNTPPAAMVRLGEGLAAYCSSARFWAFAPVTWYNGTILGEQLDKLDAVLKGSKPGEVIDELNYWPGRFPAEDHLEPAMPARVAAAQGDKEALLEQLLFREAFGPNVRARVRMIFLPQPVEVMAFLTENNGHYRLVRLHIQQTLRSITSPLIPRRGHPAPKPIDPNSMVVLRKSDQLPAAVAREIIADWKDALVWAVPAGRGHRGMDGSRYIFSMEDPSGAYAGLSWSAPELPVLGALQNLANDMSMICEYGATTIDHCYFGNSANFATDARELTKALKVKRQ